MVFRVSSVFFGAYFLGFKVVVFVSFEGGVAVKVLRF